MPYCAVADVKAYLDSPDTSDDTLLTSVISRVSSMIDAYMRTIRSSFVSFEAQTLTKYFDGDGYRFLEVPDLLTITTLASDTGLDGLYSTTIASTDYWLLDVAPYTWIELTGRGTTTAFTEGTRTIKIVGTWGYAATCPAAVTEAVIEECARVFKSKAAAWSDAIGVAGDGGVVLSRALSARSKMILDSYARWVFA